MRVQNHGDKHDGISEQDRDHRLPPVHAGFDESAGQGVGRDHHAHTDPKRRDVPSGPSSLADSGRGEIAIPQRARRHVALQLDEVSQGGAMHGSYRPSTKELAVSGFPFEFPILLDNVSMTQNLLAYATN